MIGKKRLEPDGPGPFIIRKATSHRKTHHHGAWKVAYADFVTSMMALFIVLWAAEQSPAVRQSIAGYFRSPSILPSGRADAGVLPSGAGVIAAEAASAANGTETDERALAEAAMNIKKALDDDPALRALREQVRIEMTPEGLRIQVVERDDSLFFEVGSAQVKPTLTRLLGVIAGIVGKLPNEMVVEGHTDTRQYARYGQGYSNWELSADRANSARRVLEATGIRERQIVRVVGFADHELLVQDNPLDAQNRRVSIIVRHTANPAAAKVRANDDLDRLARLGAARSAR
ncbi:MAG: OmpA family protein [Candidatus Rokubacteria bacterium]|nr:OmpA family protein [Candidatus Rokubacteria bacterium]